MTAASYLDHLNDQQREAVLHTEGPLLILAGAGAGKTKTLTYRIFRLIENGATPNSILAITFTNKAAAEMRERIQHLLGETSYSLPVAKTFHSLALSILREDHHVLGLPRFFSIFDRGDSLSAVKEAIKRVPGGEQIKPSSALTFISSKKSDNVALEDFETEAEGQYRVQIYAQLWREYEQILKGEKALDFDDLLVRTVELLNKYPLIRDKYRDRFKYLHVDEYQDTNGIQYALSKLLVGPEQNICVVGDSDQTIYTWRGAQIQNILDFERDFPGAKTVLLEQNYRSTKTILKAANECIKKNTLRKEKNLFTDNEDGECISLSVYVTENDEAQGVAQSISKLIEEGVSEDEIGILYRANFQSRGLEEALVRAGVPYKLLGVRFFDRKEVKDVLSYLRAAFNRESKTDLLRAASFPKRGLGPTTIEKLARGEGENLSGAAKKKAFDFMRFLDQIKVKGETEPPSTVVKFIIEESGLEEALKLMGDEGEDRLQNVYELVSLASRFDETPGVEGLEKLLENASLLSENDELGAETQKGVQLMTVHAAKGLEFDYVFITGLEEGLFPQRKERATKAEEEEERRLFYVALTRAKKKLFLSYALSRLVFGSRMHSMPSEFVTEMNADLVERTTQTFSDTPYRTNYLDDIEF